MGHACWLVGDEALTGCASVRLLADLGLLNDVCLYFTSPFRPEQLSYKSRGPLVMQV